MTIDFATQTASGQSVYATITNNMAMVWNGTTFVNYTDADIYQYAIDLTERSNSGFYYGNVPSAIPAGNYFIEFFVNGHEYQLDALIAGGDLEWNGSVVISTAPPS